jgi:hypothetical protein
VKDVESNTSIGRKRREVYFIARMSIKECRLVRYRKGSEMHFSLQVEAAWGEDGEYYTEYTGL